jgi:hypothetical protein
VDEKGRGRQDHGGFGKRDHLVLYVVERAGRGLAERVRMEGGEKGNAEEEQEEGQEDGNASPSGGWKAVQR